MAEGVIVTEQLTKHYGKIVGVEDLDLEVEEGEIFGFLGPNGAGKTTTLRLLMGLLLPTRGRAAVLGMDCWDDTVGVKQQVGYLPGDASLYPRLTGEQHIKFMAGFNEKGEKAGVELASRFELDLDRRVREASRGMKQKLALVLALMKDPTVLILDEPTNALDPLIQKVLYDIIREVRESGTTVMFSSHNLFEVERLCDRVGIIKEGRLAATERIEDLAAKRLRHVEVSFAEEVPPGLESMDGLSELEVTEGRVRFRFAGDIDDLVKELSGYHIVDLNVGHASLEDVFLEFYGGDRGEGG